MIGEKYRQEPQKKKHTLLADLMRQANKTGTSIL
jgi:hypothetical protein